MVYKKSKKKQRRNISSADVHVKSTFNNTIVSVTTVDGDVLLRSSGGKLKFKGSRKGTPFAATEIARDLVKGMHAIGIKTINIYGVGPGPGRDSVSRTLRAAGFVIAIIFEVTPIPLNGTRVSKKRRV